MTIVLPVGVEASWQEAIAAENAGEWDAVADDLLRDAQQTRDLVMRDDLLLLALVACDRADMIVGTARVFSLDEADEVAA